MFMSDESEEEMYEETTTGAAEAAIGGARLELVGIDINTGGTQCHRVTYVLEQRDFMVSYEGRNLPILITS